MKSNSWIIIRIETGESVLETFDPKIVSAINTAKYKAVPAYEYLCEMNRKIKLESK